MAALVLNVICLALDLVLGVTTFGIRFDVVYIRFVVGFGIGYAWFGAEWYGVMVLSVPGFVSDEQ